MNPCGYHRHHHITRDKNWINDSRNIFHILAKLYREQFMQLVEKEGLYPGQIPMLITIDSLNGCTQKELSQFFKYRPASITDSLKRLEKSNLIQRRQDEKDLRIVRVYITEKGKAQLAKSELVQSRLEELCFEGFEPREREQFILLAQKIILNLDKKEHTEC